MKTRKPRPELRPSKFERPADRRIVTVDQVPLRKETEKECRRAMRSSAKLREEIENFERSVVPAYEKWMEQVLGPLLKTESETESRITELEDLVTEVTAAQFWSGGTPQTAYKRVMEDRKKEGKDEDDEPFPDDEEDLGGPAADAKYPAEERMFREFVREVLGMNPDKLSKGEYRSLFREFKNQSKARENADHDFVGFPTKREHPSRVKELYRLLVRRLHPDSGADYHGESARLWHDLQEAYQNNDLERLEILLALTDLHDGSGSRQATLFHLRQVTAEFLRTEKNLKAKLAQLRKTPAGVHAACRDLAALEQKLRIKIEKRLNAAMSHLRNLETLVASWNVAPAKVLKPGKKPKIKKSPQGQPDFGF